MIHVFYFLSKHVKIGLMKEKTNYRTLYFSNWFSKNIGNCNSFLDLYTFLQNIINMYKIIYTDGFMNKVKLLHIWGGKKSTEQAYETVPWPKKFYFGVSAFISQCLYIRLIQSHLICKRVSLYPFLYVPHKGYWVIGTTA